MKIKWLLLVLTLIMSRACDALTFEIESIEKDKSKENCLFADTKRYRFRLYQLDDDTCIVLDAEPKENGRYNPLEHVLGILGHAKDGVVDHPIALGVPLAIAGVGSLLQ